MRFRILSMTAGSVISAMIRNLPPHSGPTVTVEANRNCDWTKARLSGASHAVVPRSAAVDRPQLCEEGVKKLENKQAIAVDDNPIHYLQGGPH
jgi:hypothetical protein